MKKDITTTILLTISVILSFVNLYFCIERTAKYEGMKSVVEKIGIGQTETQTLNEVLEISGKLDSIINRINVEEEIKSAEVEVQEYTMVEEPETKVAEVNAKCIVPEAPTNWFTCEPIDMITNTLSDQYFLQQVCSTEELTGIRYYYHNGTKYYTAALAANYGREIGDTWFVELDNGESFYIMLGDFKDDGSDPNRLGDPATNYDGKCLNVIEFIVEREEVSRHIWEYGSQSRLDRFEGSIVTMKHLGVVDWRVSE